MGKHLLPAVKLRKILHSVPQRVVDRLVRAGGKHHIRSPPRQYRIQEGCLVDDLHIHFHFRIGREVIVHHGFQNGTLITSGQDPDLYDVFIVTVIDVTYRIIIHKEGGDEGFRFVHSSVKGGSLVLLRRDVRCRYTTR